MFASFKKIWTHWGLYGAFIIVSLIVWNTNRLFQLLKEEERIKMELWASAQQELIESTDLDLDFGTLTFDVLQKIGVTPILQINAEGKIIDYKNIEWDAQKDPDSLGLYAMLAAFKKQNEPIPIVYKDIVNQKLYYGDSPLLQKLQYYPLALLLILMLFGGLLYFFFQTNKIAEQNRLWAGMAKETAHQIGTPLSSLMGWLALLKEGETSSVSMEEMQKDIERLQIITERFSKIGSLPELQHQNIVPIVENTIAYLKKRSGKQVQWVFNTPDKPVDTDVNESLLSWTLENIIKNGIDAMKGIGTLSVRIVPKQEEILIQIEDEGSGIAPKAIKDIFRPGVTSKARGWGLGLSLARRIVHDYHGGFIHVKETELNKGTVFEIMLPKKTR